MIPLNSSVVLFQTKANSRSSRPSMASTKYLPKNSVWNWSEKFPVTCPSSQKVARPHLFQLNSIVVKYDIWKRPSVDARPASCPPCHYFCPKDLLTLIVTSHHSSVTWHIMSKQSELHTNFHLLYASKITFFWPWPLTLSITLVQDIVQIHPSNNFCVRMSNGLAVRASTDRRTEGQMDGTENITSTADAGGKNDKDQNKTQNELC